MIQLLEFYSETGQVLVSTPQGNVLIDVPVEGGMYVTGAALLAYIKGLFPPAPVVQSASNAAAVAAMCVGLPEVVEESYSTKRRRAYPDFMVYVDGLVKGDTAQMQQYIDECLAVKAQFPKELVSDELLRERLGGGT